ncbi:actin cytoskeleton-regulatory complex protein pan1-like isoform X2 [Maniola jurtina]|uniref:actin cytoskeleton-regulatory complex protein pan1-like isoform X2 n=1 Tax=Maniola jurtina TaxID=191418 RepID=UPI001E68B1AD|nr:actin cytoskeleton-regulatory complex protein pan1-like isoform X2 [Maniola jurtina]
MAPPPEYDKEPKAPDKSITSNSVEDSKLVYNHVKDQSANTEHKITTTGANFDVENNKHVETLDDGQLRALLDEAITYKCPKDREGKSSLFKELLEEVEQDEQACEAAARVGAGRNTRRGRARREHHSSLQDLVAAMAGEAAPRRGRAHAAHAPAPPAGTVSARALHGGSLPSGVDTSFLLGEETGVGVARGGYLATVRCVNPPPLAERRVSTGDASPPQQPPPPAQELDVLSRRNKPMFPMTYTARATLEIGSGSVCSGRAVTTTTASNQVDSAIPFSCITTPEVVTSCNTTSSTSQSAVAVDPKPRGAAASFNGLPLSRPAAADEYKVPILTVHYRLQKSLDENGNAVQGFGSPLSGSGQHKKPRRKKSSKNETVIKSHQIDGYQGNKDINEVLRFIESNAEAPRAPKLRAKHKDDGDDKAAKKRSTERRKDKDAKPKRASSLEELSRTKLEDLTDKPRESAPAKPERRSWGADARALLEPDAPPELADFQTVTKKRKPRRRADETERAPSPPRRTRAPSPARAPASAPASERSNDSNDDTDCAHSPPPPAPAVPPPACASYADIARTRHNFPDLIESCNFYAESDERTAAPAAAAPGDEYPALAARRRDKPAVRKEPPAPDVVADRRPPVVLLAAGAGAARELDGVTFGFDVNEQLLGARCDLLERAVAVRAGCAALRYVPPPPPPARMLTQIVDYVGTAWEDVMRGGGKAHYFSECAARDN